MIDNWNRRFSVLVILFITSAILIIGQEVFDKSNEWAINTLILIMFVLIVDIKMRLK